jgi:hypothetical protein
MFYWLLKWRPADPRVLAVQAYYAMSLVTESVLFHKRYFVMQAPVFFCFLFYVLVLWLNGDVGVILLWVAHHGCCDHFLMPSASTSDDPLLIGLESESGESQSGSADNPKRRIVLTPQRAVPAPPRPAIASRVAPKVPAWGLQKKSSTPQNVPLRTAPAPEDTKNKQDFGSVFPTPHPRLVLNLLARHHVCSHPRKRRRCPLTTQSLQLTRC